MQELFARLITALSVGGPDSPDVAQLITAIEAQFPDQAPRVRALRDAWRLSRGQTPQSAVPAAVGGSSWYVKYLPWVLAVLGIGGTAAGVGGVDLSQLNLDQLALPQVTNRWALLGVFAAIGAVVGTLNSVYRNGGLVLPAVAKDHPANMLIVRNYGFLGDMFYGVVAAVAITWSAHPTTVGQDGGGNLLQWNQIVSAVVAAFAGAKAWSGWRGTQIGKLALARFIPTSSPEQVKALDSAQIADVAMMATGLQIPGHDLPPGAPAGPAQVERELFSRLLDPGKVSAVISGLGRPFGPDAVGLTAEALQAFQTLIPGLQEPLKKMSLIDLAKMSPGEFQNALSGIDTDRFRSALGPLRAQAAEVLNKFRTLPATWTLSADRIPK